MTKISHIRVVSDTDVLIHLTKLNKLSFLKSLYDEVAIPEQVKTEVLKKEHAELRKAFNSFLKAYPTSREEAQEIAKNHNIHSGEAHVKGIGREVKGDVIFI